MKIHKDKQKVSTVMDGHNHIEKFRTQMDGHTHTFSISP